MFFFYPLTEVFEIRFVVFIFLIDHRSDKYFFFVHIFFCRNHKCLFFYFFIFICHSVLLSFVLFVFKVVKTKLYSFYLQNRCSFFQVRR